VSGDVLERRWAAGRPVDVRGTLAPLRRGPGDPAHRVDAGTFWWACATPSGAGTLAVTAVPDGAHGRAWGDGAAWLLERVPTLLGERDDWSGLTLAGWPGLSEVHRRHPGVRLPATGLVLDSLVPAILEQKVTGGSAVGPAGAAIPVDPVAVRVPVEPTGAPVPFSGGGPIPGVVRGPAVAP
jgi:hypothetical protein